MTKYKPRTLAGTLLTHLGIASPEEVEREEQGRIEVEKLDTIADITAAIAKVTQRMMAGEIKAADGRAQLYGLQTLLVAKRMQHESEGGVTIPLLQAHAGVDELLSALLDMMTTTSEDTEDE